MTTELTTVMKARSTAIITVTFRDEDGQLVEPKAASWTLTTLAGVVVNSREDIAIDNLAHTIQIVLSGDDLKVFPGKSPQLRLLTIDAIYDSILENDLPWRGACSFPVEK